MQTEEHSQFRFTPQVAAVLLVTGFALMIPIALVVVAARDIFAPPAKEAPAAAPEQASAALEQSLEKAAGENLAPASLSTGDRVVTREVADIVHERERIGKLALSQGAVALNSGAGDAEGATLLIQVPAAKAEAFIQACKGLIPDDMTPAGADNGSSVLVEVVIKRKSP